MNEIEKMYENAGIGKRMMCFFECSCKACSVDCEHFEKLDMSYPPFTAEKQLLLIQWLLNRADLYLHKHKSDFTYSIASGNYAVNKYRDLEKSIAEFINAIWQSLTEEEKQQVKGILE